MALSKSYGNGKFGIAKSLLRYSRKTDMRTNMYWTSSPNATSSPYNESMMLVCHDFSGNERKGIKLQDMR